MAKGTKYPNGSPVTITLPLTPATSVQGNPAVITDGAVPDELEEGETIPSSGDWVLDPDLGYEVWVYDDPRIAEYVKIGGHPDWPFSSSNYATVQLEFSEPRWVRGLAFVEGGTIAGEVAQINRPKEIQIGYREPVHGSIIPLSTGGEWSWDVAYPAVSGAGGKSRFRRWHLTFTAPRRVDRILFGATPAYNGGSATAWTIAELEVYRETPTPPSFVIDFVAALDATHVEVTFSKAARASVWDETELTWQAAHFTFDNGLTRVGASTGDWITTTIETSPQTPGELYTLTVADTLTSSPYGDVLEGNTYEFTGYEEPAAPELLLIEVQAQDELTLILFFNTTLDTGFAGTTDPANYSSVPAISIDTVDVGGPDHLYVHLSAPLSPGVEHVLTIAELLAEDGSVLEAGVGSFTWGDPPPPPPPPPIPGGPPSLPNEPRRTFRDAMREISTPWLRGIVGGGVLYAIGYQFDMLTDALLAGVKARFPGLYTYESLALLGRERRIRRGRTESDEVYASRMLPWLDHHRIRGGPYAMLAQIHAHYAPANFLVELRYTSSRRYSMALDGTVTRSEVAWTPPGNPAQWARWWLYYEWPTPIDDDGIWSDPGTWDDGGVWDSNLSPTEVRDARLVPREWNAAHAIGRVVLVSPLETVSLSVEGA
jgi:hypothetical protein